MRAGIVVDSLGVSQMSTQLTSQLNRADELETFWDVILFYHEYDRIISPPLFAMMQSEELWGFDAPVIATSIHTADRLIKSPRPTKKLFYVWDLEWMYRSHDIDDISAIYCHPELSLIARSQSHYDILKQSWREPVGIIEDFKYEDIINTLKK